MELVFPRGITGGFGLHPLFLFDPSFYRTSRRDGADVVDSNDASSTSTTNEMVEPVPPEMKSRRMVRILDLTKVYCGSITDCFRSTAKPAVDRLSFDVYEGMSAVRDSAFSHYSFILNKDRLSALFSPDCRFHFGYMIYIGKLVLKHASYSAILGFHQQGQAVRSSLTLLFV